MTEHTVYISNMSKAHDYAKAAKFGAIRPITSGNYPIFKTTRLMEEIIEALSESTEDDYLLLSGSSVIAALCMLVWSQMHKRVAILLFDRRQDDYVERVEVRAEIREAINKTIDKREGTPHDQPVLRR